MATAKLQVAANGGIWMKAFKCDRCGTFYTVPAFIQIVDGDGFAGETSLDLCPGCMCEFYEWRCLNGE